MRARAVKIAFFLATIAIVMAAPVIFAQQDQQQPQQPGAPAPQQQPPSSPPDSKPMPPRPSSTSDSSDQESTSKKDLPPDDESANKEKNKSHASKPGVLPPEDDAAWDPFHAQQDVDVGTFYMHKGDTDAAIARFEDAIRLRANFAKPRLLLAAAYEKKGENSEAIRYYKEYLKVLPNAPDAKKVQQKIEKLSNK
ncbi:MAG: tetratricopeptide repeat protein [Candidatus Acidiferrales bacterium]